MKIDPAIAARHWEQAAIEQVATQLRSEDFAVETEVELQPGLHADLVATKDAARIVYEVQVDGMANGPADRLRRLRAAARGQGARFKLMLVAPPRSVRAAVEGIEQTILDAIREVGRSDLVELGHRQDAHLVDGVQIETLEARHGRLEVGGIAVVAVQILGNEDTDLGTHDFPVTFELSLGPDGKLQEVRHLRIDTDSWDA